MGFIILIILVILLLVYILFSKRKIRALFISFGVFVAYILIMECIICGPSSKDIKAIKPMAQAMKSYILEHGMPKNLEMIPNLPYKLYQKKDNKSFYYFKVGNDKYEIFKNGRDMLEFTSLIDRLGGRTRLWMDFNIDQKGKYLLNEEKYFAVHYSGICQPMRQ